MDGDVGREGGEVVWDGMIETATAGRRGERGVRGGSGRRRVDVSRRGRGKTGLLSQQWKKTREKMDYSVWCTRNPSAGRTFDARRAGRSSPKVELDLTSLPLSLPSERRLTTLQDDLTHIHFHRIFHPCMGCKVFFSRAELKWWTSLSRAFLDELKASLSLSARSC